MIREYILAIDKVPHIISSSGKKTHSNKMWKENKQKKKKIWSAMLSAFQWVDVWY